MKERAILMLVSQSLSKVYVNYGMEAYAADGVNVPARDCTVERGE